MGPKLRRRKIGLDLLIISPWFWMFGSPALLPSFSICRPYTLLSNFQNWECTAFNFIVAVQWVSTLWLHSTLFTIVGHVCDALSVDPVSRCCSEKGEQFDCQWVIFDLAFQFHLEQKCYEDRIMSFLHACSGCNLDSQCCNSYEFCVSCCQDPAHV